MSREGSVFTDMLVIGFWLAVAVCLVWWVMPADWEQRFATMMDAALPLGDATVIEYEHAIIGHNAEAIAVRDCLRQSGPFQVWQKPDGRFVRLCNLPDGKFGIQICQADYNGEECFHEVTAFIKNKFTKLEQLIKYLENIGASKVFP